MKAISLAGVVAICAFAPPCHAQEHRFAGPRIGVEAAYENYGANTDGAAFAVVAGWDVRLGRSLIAGVEGRYTVHSVSGSETSTTPANNLQTIDLVIRDNWGVSGRIGHVLGNDVLLFAQAGYERMRFDAVRTTRGQVCAPPNGCQLTRTDFSFNDDMWTVGAGAEWAMTDNLRLRGQYTYGDSGSYDRSRFALGIALQF